MANSRQLVAAVALVVSAACSNTVDLSDPRVVATELRGTWSQSFTVPGVSTVLHLSVSGTTITGTGTFAEEAGPSGTLSITGAITDAPTPGLSIAGANATQQAGPPFVTLFLSRSDGLLGHFSGALSSINSLTGSLLYTSATLTAVDPILAEFRRTSQ